MNGKEKKDLELIVYRLDEADKKREELKDDLEQKIEEIHTSMVEAHQKTSEDLKFIKENLFNPNEGLWAETKANSAFRANATKSFWVLIPTTLFASLKIVWDYIAQR